MNFSWQALVAFCEPSQAKVKTLERLVQRARQPTTGCENQDKSLTKSATSQGRLKELERPIIKRRQGSSSARAVCTEFEAHCTRKGCAGSPSWMASTLIALPGFARSTSRSCCRRGQLFNVYHKKVTSSQQQLHFCVSLLFFSGKGWAGNNKWYHSLTVIQDMQVESLRPWTSFSPNNHEPLLLALIGFKSTEILCFLWCTVFWNARCGWWLLSEKDKDCKVFLPWRKVHPSIFAFGFEKASRIVCKLSKPRAYSGHS